MEYNSKDCSAVVKDSGGEKTIEIVKSVAIFLCGTEMGLSILTFLA